MGDKPGMAPRFLGFVDFARDGAGGAGEEGGGASALSARRAYATGAPGPGKVKNRLLGKRLLGRAKNL